MPSDVARARRGGHIPSLDGVRGLAILLVLVYHCILYGGMRPQTLVDEAMVRLGSSGWLGVDLFFVLSGFLITGILLDSRRSPTYFRAFYSRRVLRIFPLYFVFLAAYLWVLPALRTMDPGFESLRGEQIWYWTYLTNIRIAWEGWPSYGALGHFWSLAVEEQFYLVWPFVVFAARRRALVWICLGCIALAFLVRVGLVAAGEHTAAHVLTVTRLDALATGGLLATLIRREDAGERLLRLRRPVLVACLAVLAGMFAYFRAFWSEIPAINTVGLSLVTLAGGALIATMLFEDGPRRLSKIFEHPSLRFLGKYSYGIYVIHHPLVIALGESRIAADQWPTLLGSQLPGQLAMILIGSGLSIGAALVSWTLLEAPLLRLKRRFPYAPGTPAEPGDEEIDARAIDTGR